MSLEKYTYNIEKIKFKEKIPKKNNKLLKKKAVKYFETFIRGL